jgi:hypothetical protein
MKGMFYLITRTKPMLFGRVSEEEWEFAFLLLPLLIFL